MRIGKVEPSGRPVIWTSLKLGPDLTGHPSGSTFPILTMTPWKILFVLFYLLPTGRKLNFAFHLRAKSRKYRGYSKSIVRKDNDKFGKGLVSTSRTYASPKGTGSGVRRSKRPLSACHTRRKCSMDTSQNSVKGRVRYKVWSVGGCHCIWPGHRMSFNICERNTRRLQYSYYKFFVPG